ncbi:MAG: integration host factor, actinobacterial type [Pseudonocardiaceae bacterium]
MPSGVSGEPTLSAWRYPVVAGSAAMMSAHRLLWVGNGKGLHVMALPTLTSEQRQDALRAAAAARSARKQLCEEIARGELRIPEVLDRAKADPVVAKTRVTQLLKSLPGYGEAKVTALMEQTGIAASRRAGGLGQRQRQALCDALT